MPNNRWHVIGDLEVTPPQGTASIGSRKGTRCSVNGTRIPQSFGFAHRTAGASYKVKPSKTPIFWTIDPKEHPVPLLDAKIECAGRAE